MQFADVACALKTQTAIFYTNQRPDHFTVCAVGEHIHRREALGAVAFLGQESEVAGHRLGVAADVDHPLRGHAGHALDELRGGALPGRVNEADVGLLAHVGGFT